MAAGSEAWTPYVKYISWQPQLVRCFRIELLLGDYPTEGYFE